LVIGREHLCNDTLYNLSAVAELPAHAFTDRSETRVCGRNLSLRRGVGSVPEPRILGATPSVRVRTPSEAASAPIWWRALGIAPAGATVRQVAPHLQMRVAPVASRVVTADVLVRCTPWPVICLRRPHSSVHIHHSVSPRNV